jgi:hypothetical protein
MEEPTNPGGAAEATMAECMAVGVVSSVPAEFRMVEATVAMSEVALKTSRSCGRRGHRMQRRCSLRFRWTTRHRASDSPAVLEE